MIRLENFSCSFDGHVVLQDINATLPAGSTALIGPNGAGKSTLLQACADGGRHLRGATLQGRLLLDNDQLLKLPVDVLARRRAFLPQQHADTLALTVADLLDLAGWPYGRSTLAGDPLHTQALARWELPALLSRRYDALSGGERQRVQLARTWLQMRLCEPAEKRLWLLDEPQNALDLPHQQRLRQVLEDEGASGALIVFSTHDLNFALRTARHFLFLREGRLLAQGGAELLQDDALLQTVFGVGFDRLTHQVDGRPWLLPH